MVCVCLSVLPCGACVIDSLDSRHGASRIESTDETNVDALACTLSALRSGLATAATGGRMRQQCVHQRTLAMRCELLREPH
eukprot:3084403-Prymnesium_polylepis.1